jgi:tetratricopeptide (TPR) repeat protein
VNLGIALSKKGNQSEAEKAYRKALRLQPTLAFAHYNLGVFLCDRKHDYDGAQDALREALRLQPNDAQAHNTLGNVFRKQGRGTEAEAEYREALRLRPDLALAHYNLGVLLSEDRHDEDRALAAFREVIRLKPEWTRGYLSLGETLCKTGDVEGAITAFRQVLAIDPHHASGYCDLGLALRQKGQLGPALGALKTGHELGLKIPNWSCPSGQWVAECERLIELEARLPELLQGKLKPISSPERIEFAQLCVLKRYYVAAARLYQEALSVTPDQRSTLYPAACAAIGAGCGNGEEAPPLKASERLRWRKQALDWLRAELERQGQSLRANPSTARRTVFGTLRQWKRDPSLAGVRDLAALSRLPEEEWQNWSRFWIEVEGLLEQAQRPDPS